MDGRTNKAAQICSPKDFWEHKKEHKQFSTYSYTMWNGYRHDLGGETKIGVLTFYTTLMVTSRHCYSKSNNRTRCPIRGLSSSPQSLGFGSSKLLWGVSVPFDPRPLVAVFLSTFAWHILSGRVFSWPRKKLSNLLMHASWYSCTHLAMEESTKAYITTMKTIKPYIQRNVLAINVSTERLKRRPMPDKKAAIYVKP